jgi:transposase
MELRERVVAFVDEGHGHRETARHFLVSPKFVNDMIKLRRETGALLAKPQGNLGRAGKLKGLNDWVRARLAEQGELTLDELCLELAQLHDVTVHRSAVGRWLHRLSLSHKKNSARQRAASRGRGASAAYLDHEASTFHG